MEIYEENLEKFFSDNNLSFVLDGIPNYYLQASSVDRRLVGTMPLEGKKMLNVGCGAHLISDIYFALKGAEIISVDIDMPSIDKAKTKLDKIKEKNKNVNIKIILDDGRHLSFEDSSFDIVVSFSAIEHMKEYNDRLKAVAEMARVTKPGGHVIITGPNLLNLPTTFFSRRVFKKLGRYEHRYLPWELKGMFVKCGLEIKSFDAESVFLIDKDLIDIKLPYLSVVPPIFLKPLSLILYEFNRNSLLKILGMRMGFKANKI